MRKSTRSLNNVFTTQAPLAHKKKMLVLLLRILQETVRRECEERLELTDALGEART